MVFIFLLAFLTFFKEVTFSLPHYIVSAAFVLFTGYYRSATDGTPIKLADGKREMSDAEFSSLAASDNPTRADCAACQCGKVLSDQKIKFADCSETHPFVCEYRGIAQSLVGFIPNENVYLLSIVGNACPKGMVLLYGKCVGVVKNVHPISRDANCHVTNENWDYQLYKFDNFKPEIDMVTEYLTTQGMELKGVIMAGTDKTSTIGLYTIKSLASLSEYHFMARLPPFQML